MIRFRAFPRQATPDNAVLSPSVLISLVDDMFQPVGGLAIKLFLNGDVGHGCSWGGSVPMLFAWWEPDHVARVDLFNGPTPKLGQAGT